MLSKAILEQSFFIESGDHMVMLYEDDNEVEDYLVAFIHGSLKKNERCLFITGGGNTPAILSKVNALESEGPRSGDLVLMTRDEGYSKSGRFDPDQMIALLQQMSETARSEGYSGLSVTGEISWVLDYDKGDELIVEYEWKLNERLFATYPVSALCRYNIHQYSDEMISQVIQLHPLIIYKNVIHENPFYIPPEGFKFNAISQYQVKTWLENIQKFTLEKGRFRQAISLKEQDLQKLHEKMTGSIIKALSNLLSVHDPYTNGHNENVASLARDFALSLGLTEDTVAKVYYAGLVHDIGKTLIPKEILNKAGPLTPSEYDIVKKHPLTGAATLKSVSGLEEITLGIRHHHERWDGRGYPDGLRGDEMPVISRILALADTFDAMTNNRPYRRAFSRERALEEILQCAGSQFEASLAIAFVDYLRKQNAGELLTN
ncbi:MAG: hypothetical protein AVO33_08440 [delta proteobacterium ML8_F1]|nr:MAG: hypothetical protein AVO33_08440 [delta proteobacterium ML8_F1]